MEMIAPFELPEQQEEGGQSPFYASMLSFYQEMYQNPEAYPVFPKLYEEYMAKLKKQEARVKKKKEHEMDRIMNRNITKHGIKC